jgi:hypothetical protein
LPKERTLAEITSQAVLYEATILLFGFFTANTRKLAPAVSVCTTRGAQSRRG